QICKKSFLEQSLDVLHADLEPTHEVPSAEVPSSPSARTVRGMTQWLITTASAVLKVPAEKIDPSQPLSRYGLDSVAAVELQTAADTAFNVELPISLLMADQTIEQVAAFLAVVPPNTP